MGNEKKYEILLDEFLRRVLSSNNPDETINLFIEKIISQISQQKILLRIFGRYGIILSLSITIFSIKNISNISIKNIQNGKDMKEVNLNGQSLNI